MTTNKNPVANPRHVQIWARCGDKKQTNAKL
jgi:hypothetical protein